MYYGFSDDILEYRTCTGGNSVEIKYCEQCKNIIIGELYKNNSKCSCSGNICFSCWLSNVSINKV